MAPTVHKYKQCNFSYTLFLSCPFGARRCKPWHCSRPLLLTPNLSPPASWPNCFLLGLRLFYNAFVVVHCGHPSPARPSRSYVQIDSVDLSAILFGKPAFCPASCPLYFVVLVLHSLHNVRFKRFGHIFICPALPPFLSV